MLTTNVIRRAHRGGFTLVELMIAMALMGIIGGAIVMLLLRQQRFYNSTNELIQTRQQIRQAAAMLPSDLRGISSVGGDIIAMTDSSIDFRSVFGSSVACTIDQGAGNWVSTAPVILTKGSALTNWATVPLVGDSVAVYGDGDLLTSKVDDAWTIARITSVTARTGGASDGCPIVSGLVQNLAADLAATNPSYKLAISPGVPSVSSGAGLRFFRRVRYSLYKAPDNQWYLGYVICKPVGGVISCNNPPLQIGGPFQAYAAAGAATSGLQFTYYDSTGTVTATRANVARISLAVRGQGASLVSFGGTGAATTFKDSLRMEINLRNKK